MAVAIVLDPAEVASGRTQLDISNWAASEVDWGDAAVEAYMAEAAVGQVPVDFRVPNRTVTIPLRLRTVGATSFGTIRTQVQAKAALMQRQGGWLKRTSALGDVFADVVSATLHLGGSGFLEDVRQADVDATLTLECLPEWYQAEVDLGTTSETSAAELRKVMNTVKGNYPGRARIVVNETQGQNQLSLLWGMRSANYTGASTAALAYEAEALTPLDQASVTTLSGASGGASNNRVSHPNVGPSWTPILSTVIASGSADMTHVGSYRVWARVFSTSTIPPRVRFVWNVGTLSGEPEENAPATLAGANSIYVIDLGEIRLDPMPVGTHRWQGQVQAYGIVGENISIDKLWFVPIDDGYGVVRMTPSTLTGSIPARDEFTATTAGGTLNGRTASVGGAWATSGAATDFEFLDASGSVPPVEAAGRSVASASFRYGILGGTAIDQYVTAVLGRPVGDDTGECGVVARWTDASNYVRATLTWVIDTSGAVDRPTITFRVIKVVAGTPTTLASRLFYEHSSSAWQSISVTITASGDVTARARDQDNTLRTEMHASDTALATGGTLQGGKAGIIDSGDGSTVTQRWYANFRESASAPVPVVLNASRSAQLTTNGHFRQTADGTGYDQISYVIGDLPRLPPSGLEGRSVELFVKASRGDLDARPDAGIDDISVQVLYRPSWLFLPEA